MKISKKRYIFLRFILLISLFLVAICLMRLFGFTSSPEKIDFLLHEFILTICLCISITVQVYFNKLDTSQFLKTNPQKNKRLIFLLWSSSLLAVIGLLLILFSNYFSVGSEISRLLFFLSNSLIALGIYLSIYKNEKRRKAI